MPGWTGGINPIVDCFTILLHIFLLHLEYSIITPTETFLVDVEVNHGHSLHCFECLPLSKVSRNELLCCLLVIGHTGDNVSIVPELELRAS